MHGCVHPQVLPAPPHGRGLLRDRLPPHAIYGAPRVPAKTTCQPVCAKVYFYNYLCKFIKMICLPHLICSCYYIIHVQLGTVTKTICLIWRLHFFPSVRRLRHVSIMAAFYNPHCYWVVIFSCCFFSGYMASRSTPWLINSNSRLPPASRVLWRLFART